jgi:glucoamylase
MCRIFRRAIPAITAAAFFTAAHPATQPAAAPGAPGARATWTNGNKQGIGTSTTVESKVWFTLGDGVLNEVYYPTVDVANLRSLEFIAADGRGFVERESVDTRHEVELAEPDVLIFRQTNTSRSGRYRITRVTITDPARSAVLVQARFEVLTGDPLSFYVFVDPAVRNSGLGDNGRSTPEALITSDGAITVAVAAGTPFIKHSTGYLGTSDGLAGLRAASLPAHARAESGNVTQVAEVGSASSGTPLTTTLAVAFGATEADAVKAARDSIAGTFETARRSYVSGWRAYVGGLEPVDAQFQALYPVAAMVLAAHEDKTRRGAMIASLTIPWGDGVDASSGDVGGYHLVWSRDLYHVATAFMAMGDRDAAGRALTYLFSVQQKPDGSFPQNSWLDGRPYWGSLQLDEVAYPLVLAWQLDRTDAKTYNQHIRRAADFLVAHGPGSPQERWEEEAGYSPSTIAAEIAGLVCAAAIAQKNGDQASAARWLTKADEWNRNVERWTVTRNGRYSAEPYFIRLSAAGEPDSGAPLELNNGAGTFDERTIVDAGFLELVRLGIRPANDPLIARSLSIIDRQIRVDTPNGPAWYRYNHDGYGEKPDGRGYDGTGVGRLWPLLTGERGEYELARGGNARPYLEALQRFANEGLMLPEQVWDRPDGPRPSLVFGEATGSATPLAWTNAQFIRLARSLAVGRIIEMPGVVHDRFNPPR